MDVVVDCSNGVTVYQDQLGSCIRKQVIIINFVGFVGAPISFHLFASTALLGKDWRTEWKRKCKGEESMELKPRRIRAGT